MKSRSLTLLCAAVGGASIVSTFAGKGTVLEPKLAKPGEIVTTDGFDAATLAKPWAVAKGDWQIKDGALVGNMKKSDNHGAVLTLAEPNRNSIIRFAFKLEGNKGFGLSYNSSKGHLFRINITGEGFSVNKDKDKKDPKSKALVMANVKGKITSGEWHTMQVEILGEKVAVKTDFGMKADVSHKDLDVDKTGYRFVTGGSVILDDVQVWKVE